MLINIIIILIIKSLKGTKGDLLTIELTLVLIILLS